MGHQVVGYSGASSGVPGLRSQPEPWHGTPLSKRSRGYKRTECAGSQLERCQSGKMEKGKRGNRWPRVYLSVGGRGI